MQSRAEVATSYARAYLVASNRDEGRVLDEVVSVTGWSRDNARRRIFAAPRRPPGSGPQIAKRSRKQRASTCSYDAVKVLQRARAASGGQGGKYLAAVDVPGVRVLESLVGHTAESHWAAAR